MGTLCPCRVETRCLLPLKAYSFSMDRDAVLNRVGTLRDKVAFLVREIQEYENRTFHSVQNQLTHAARMQCLEQIKAELADIKAARFLPPTLAEIHRTFSSGIAHAYLLRLRRG